MTVGAFICFFLAAAGSVWLAMVWRGLSQDWMPDDLKAGRLVRVERGLHTDAPYAVVGRPDQVFQLEDGKYTLVELKNRDAVRVYDTDIAEISLRGWLLRQNHFQTAAHGYVTINNRKTGRRTAVKVKLEDDAFCEQLIKRHLLVVAGTVRPVRNRGPKCKSCGHVSRCQ